MKKLLLLLFPLMLVGINACKDDDKKPGTVLVTPADDDTSRLPIIEGTFLEDGVAPVADATAKKAEKQKKEKVSCTMNQQKFNNRKRPKEEAPGGIRGKPQGKDQQPPTLNGNITLSNIQSTRIDLSWPAASDNKSGVTYDLYRNGVKINLAPISLPSFIDVGLSSSTTYTYYYQARDAAGNYSLFSSSVTGTTLAGNTDPPPTNSQNVVYLNFWGSEVSGTMWNTNGIIIATEAGFVQIEIDQIITQVLRHFPLYDVKITTNKAEFDAAQEGKKMEVIITENYQWYGQAGGVAYINSFFWTSKEPAWVFSLLLNYNTHYVAEAIAHEAMHTLGLRHQSDCVGGVVTNQYRNGWVMGVSYYVDLGIQGVGTSSLSCQTQDDVAKLTAALGLKQFAIIQWKNYDLHFAGLKHQSVFAILPKQYKF